MNVTDDHWLNTATRKPIPGGDHMPVRRFLVIHHTAGASAMSSIDYWREDGDSGPEAHLVIDRDGTVYQCRPFNRQCGHAGKSSWADPNTGVTHTNLNHCSIGIELANAGSDASALRWARKQPGFQSVTARHKNGGPEVEWECYTEAQVKALADVCKVLVARYKIDSIAGHDDIAPRRKTDPGPAFPWGKFREMTGFDK